MGKDQGGSMSSGDECPGERRTFSRGGRRWPGGRVDVRVTRDGVTLGGGHQLAGGATASEPEQAYPDGGT